MLYVQPACSIPLPGGKLQNTAVWAIYCDELRTEPSGQVRTDIASEPAIAEDCAHGIGPLAEPRSDIIVLSSRSRTSREHAIARRRGVPSRPGATKAIPRIEKHADRIGRIGGIDHKWMETG